MYLFKVVIIIIFALCQKRQTNLDPNMKQMITQLTQLTTNTNLTLPWLLYYYQYLWGLNFPWFIGI